MHVFNIDPAKGVDAGYDTNCVICQEVGVARGVAGNSVRRPGDHWWWRLGLHGSLRLDLMEPRRPWPWCRVLPGQEECKNQEKKNDQQIDFSRALAFRAPKGIEVVFVQTHNFPPWKLTVSLGRTNRCISTAMSVRLQERSSQTEQTRPSPKNLPDLQSDTTPACSLPADIADGFRAKFVPFSFWSPTRRCFNRVQASGACISVGLRKSWLVHYAANAHTQSHSKFGGIA